MRIQEVIDALERFAPLPLQESYDNAGLQIGLTEANVSGVLLCLDVTEKVLAEAVEKGCNLIVSHHPLLFRGLKQISDQNLVARCVRYALQHNLAIYSAHTNLDNARDGVNFEIMNRLGGTFERFIEEKENGGSGVIFTLPEAERPMDFLQRVKTTFGVHTLMHNACTKTEIRRVAVCGGAGDEFLDGALRQKCDAFLTGEMHYHVYFGHEDEILIGVLGHYESEKFTIQLLHRILERSFPTLQLIETQINTNAINYF